MGFCLTYSRNNGCASLGRNNFCQTKSRNSENRLSVNYSSYGFVFHYSFTLRLFTEIVEQQWPRSHVIMVV